MKNDSTDSVGRDVTGAQSPYPKYRYHATKEAVLVHSPEEEIALGEDWRDSRADLEAEEGAGDS